MRNPIRRSGLATAALVLAAGLVLGACGGGNDDSAKGGTLLSSALQAEINGDFSTAKAKFEEVLQADPTDRDRVLAHYNLGYIAQTQERDNAKAKTEYEAALETDPNYTAALYNLAIVETAAGNQSGAIELYKRAIAANPAYSDAYLNLGFLLYDNGDTAGADAAFRKAIAGKPELRSRIPADRQPVG